MFTSKNNKSISFKLYLGLLTLLLQYKSVTINYYYVANSNHINYLAQELLTSNAFDATTRASKFRNLYYIQVKTSYFYKAGGKKDKQAADAALRCLRNVSIHKYVT